MFKLNDLHPVIQQTIHYFSNSHLSYEKIAQSQEISKQAVHQQVQKGLQYLSNYGEQNSSMSLQRVKHLENEVERLGDLVNKLQKELCLRSAEIYQLKYFKEQVNKIFPDFKISRLPARGKKYFIDMCAKYQNLGGTITDFSKYIGKSPSTILNWKKTFKEKGMTGLYNKKTRPKNFGNKIPSWVKQQLLNLFLRFPRWSEYQYHNYIKYSPSAKYYVSIPTIKKLKDVHSQKTKKEKERIKKRWAFAPGTDVWTVDFTCILKSNNFKLQLLTVSDTRSRFMFQSALFLDTSTESMVEHLEELFATHGKPMIIKADNGPEFRLDCRNDLKNLGVHLLNNPVYYGQFNGAHERLHRTLKAYITDFKKHNNISRLVDEINRFTEEYNHDMHNEYLDGRTPFEMYGDSNFVPAATKVELVKPYTKGNELRVKFTDRNDKPARIIIDKI